ncbi:MAG: accessory gene regulator B family protein [Oscillospiraceae bacterium]|nr:accessory gene regulator B family protein [Oscillospiraceae bacterium]
MFVKLSEYITQRLENEKVIQPDNRELYRYGFQQGLILLLNFVTSVIIGVIFGKALESVLILATYIPLRSYAGGHHSD